MKNCEGEKFRAQSARKEICSCHPTIRVCPHLLGTHAFLPHPSPIEAMHDVTIMSLTAIVVQSVGTVLTSRQIL